MPYGSLNTSRAGEEAFSLSWLSVSGSMYRGEVSNWSCSWPITALEAGQDTAGNTRGEDEDIRAPCGTRDTKNMSVTEYPTTEVRLVASSNVYLGQEHLASNRGWELKVIGLSLHSGYHHHTSRLGKTLSCLFPKAPPYMVKSSMLIWWGDKETQAQIKKKLITSKPQIYTKKLGNGYNE